ncbi:MAG TPA: HNH endonuclease signature motif containing protein [Marmoricola sp.]
MTITQQSTPARPPGAGARGAGALLDAVVDAAVEERRGAARKLAAALAWAHGHPGRAGDCASWDPQLRLGEVFRECEDGLDRLGGEGTPAVAEFAVEQLATRLGVSTGSAMQLVADALNLAHRHPALWSRIQDLEVPAWLGAKIARGCAALPLEGARWLDDQTGHLAGRCAWSVIARQVAYAIATWCPDTTREAEAQAKDTRRLDVHLPDPARRGSGRLADSAAVADLVGRLSTTDAIKFEALVAAKAAELATLGDHSSLDVRRSKALGLIADQLLCGELDLEDCDRQPANRLPGSSSRVPARKAASTVLYLHASLAELATWAWAGHGATPNDWVEEVDAGPVVAWAEKYGPLIGETLTEWLRETNATVRPVLDLARTDAVDAHDPPRWMRELVILRDGHCVFPWCGTPARATDLDHIDPYVPPSDGGPPGQTRPDNLAPLCRRHHRCKTFTRWSYRRRPDGAYEWSDAEGRRYLVRPRDGTHPLRS